MNNQEFRIMIKDFARIYGYKITEKDVKASIKAQDGYNNLVWQLDGLLDCILNGPNDHLLVEVNLILDALEMINKTKNSFLSNLPKEQQEIAYEEIGNVIDEKLKQLGY